jgi:hypothetical protein
MSTSLFEIALSLANFFSLEGIRPRFAGWFVLEKRVATPLLNPSSLGIANLLHAVSTPILTPFLSPFFLKFFPFSP